MRQNGRAGLKVVVIDSWIRETEKSLPETHLRCWQRYILIAMSLHETSEHDCRQRPKEIS